MITDINPRRLKLAEEVAEVVAVDVSKTDLKETMSRLKMTEGFDVALEMSGAPAAFDQLFDAIITGGRVALLGLPAKPALVDWNKVIFKQLTIKGIYGREMFETWHKMIAMLESGLDVRKVITHRLPADKFLEGFEIIGRNQAPDRLETGRESPGQPAAVEGFLAARGDLFERTGEVRLDNRSTEARRFTAGLHAETPARGGLGQSRMGLEGRRRRRMRSPARSERADSRTRERVTQAGPAASLSAASTAPSS